MPMVIDFAADAHVVDGRQIMGRRMAGAAFLRAAVENRGAEPLVGYVPDEVRAKTFTDAIRAVDPTAPVQWIPRGRHDLLARAGTLLHADPLIGSEARLRLRTGAAGFSLCGITHTLLGGTAMEGLVQLISEPVMPWDAIICTSNVARDVVQSSWADALDYMRWRIGAQAMPPMPQLPVIPLGVHSADWTGLDRRRETARRHWSIGADEVAVLFAGRLSYSAKAHPFQMYEALRAVAEGSDKPITLLLAGQFYNENIEGDFLDTARRICPAVRCIHVDGVEASDYADAFAAADIFLSLADNLQETFGITVIEAMAAGLPVIASDWNGYRDTLRDGIDGFRIPCWAPGADAGVPIARDEEASGSYSTYASRTSTAVSMDMAALVDRLGLLVRDPALRRTMGAAAQARAVSDFDWSVVYRRYRDLSVELAAIRRTASATDAPRAYPSHADPFHRFASYPTHAIGAGTLVRAAPGADRAAYEALIAQPIFSFWRIQPEMAGRIIAAASPGPVRVDALAGAIDRSVDAAIEMIARLAKMNLLILEA